MALPIGFELKLSMKVFEPRLSPLMPTMPLVVLPAFSLSLI